MKIKNRILKSIFKVGILESLSSVLSIVITFLIIFIIGAEQNGMIIIVQSYCMLMNDIFNFQSFTAVIKFLSNNNINKYSNKIKQILKQAYFYDILTAIIATIVGISLLPFVSKFMGWNSSVIILINIYIISILLNINGTAIGILRYYNKFTYVALNNIVYNFIRLFIIIFLNKELTITILIILETILSIVKNLSLNILAVIILRGNGIKGLYKEKLVFDKEFFKFNIYSNITVTLDLPFQYLAIFFINKYLGFSENTIYKIFQNIGSIMTKISSPITQVIYPEMAKAVSNKNIKLATEYFKKIFKYLSILTIAISTLIYITKGIWFNMLVGTNFYYNKELLSYLVFCIISTSFMGIHPLFISLGYIKYNIRILILSNGIYCTLLLILGGSNGLEGIIISLLVQCIIVVVLKGYIIKSKDI